MDLFPQRLKELRLQKQLTQKQLAKVINAESNVIISMYESGTRTPSTDNLKALADYFDVTVSYLIGEEDKNIELEELKERLRKQPNYKILFNATKNASDEELRKFARMIEVWRGDDNDSGA